MVDYIEARAMVCSSTGSFDFVTQNRIHKPCKTNLETPCTGDFLVFFLTKKNKDFIKIEGCTGCLFLEVLSVSSDLDISSQPIAALIFTCSPADRDKILDGCFLDTALLKNRQFGINLICFTIKEMISIIQQVEGDAISFDQMRAATMKSMAGGITPLISATSWVLDYWTMSALLDVWSPPHLPGQLNKLEYNWMYFNVMMRWSKARNLDPDNFKMCIGAAEFQPLEHSLNMGPSDRHDLETFRKWWSLAKQSDIFEEVEESFIRKRRDFMVSCKLSFAIGESLEEKRRTFFGPQIHVAQIIDDIYNNNIKRAPKDMFDIGKVMKWVEDCLEEISVRLEPRAIYGKVIENAKAKVQTKAIHRTYGSINKIEGVKYSFALWKLKSLSKVQCDLPYPKLESQDLSKIKFQYNENFNMGAARLVTYAATTTAPIYLSAREKSPTFFVFTAVDNDEHLTIDQALDIMMKDGRASEMINGKLHITRIMIDIDFKVFHRNSKINSAKTAEDMVTLANWVFSKIIPELMLEHFVFKSDRQSEEDKEGFRHVICLPRNWAATHCFVKNLIQILAETRYMFPETLGRFCGLYDSTVYDPMIYGVSYDDEKTKFHPLRLPLQGKANHQHKLLCIYGEKDKIIEKKLFCHVDNADGLTGNLLTCIDGVNMISDQEHVKAMQRNRTNEYVNKKGIGTITQLQKTVNERSLVLESEEDLLILLNELWAKHGVEKMRRQLRSCIGDYRRCYTPKEIECALEKSKITVGEDGRVRLTSDGHRFQICPFKVHNNPHPKGVNVEVVTVKNMIRFGFVVKSFKTSCSNQYLSNVTIEMDDTYLCSTIKLKLENILGRTSKVAKEVVKRDISMETFSFDHSRQKLISYNEIAFNLKASDVRYLYAVYGNFAAFRTTKRSFVFIYRDIAYFSVNHELLLEAQEKDSLFPDDLFHQVINILQAQDL